jgi:geranylgeranyl diphosphate synthase, type I
MPEFLKIYKNRIDSFLASYLKKKGKDLTLINKFGKQVSDDLSAFSALGKSIRGSLVFIASTFFITPGIKKSKTVPESELLKAAAAIELFQSGLLIHDDIMDRDLTRRGKPSIFALYAQRYADKSTDSYHLGESLGICAGDLAYFHGFELLASLETDTDIKTKLHRLFSHEMLIVATAQMQDLVFGSTPAFPDIQDILSLYRFKTGRYTFSLPLCAGALLAGAGTEEIKALGDIGEIMGILFQIRDDVLGLAGQEETLGKPVGSDIAEGKKTLPLALLYQSLNKAEAQKMLEILSNDEKTNSDTTWITDLYIKQQTDKQTDALADEYSAKLKKMLADFSAPNPESFEMLYQLSDFISGRDF